MLLCESKTIIKRWKNDFVELLDEQEEKKHENYEIGGDILVLEVPDEEKVKIMLKDLKNNQKSGEN